MNNTKVWLSAGLVAVLAITVTPAGAQERYDGHEMNDKFTIRLGGFSQNGIDSTIRINSNVLGLGAIIDLENSLNVDSESTTLRLDGWYRFGNRHRFEFTWYSIDRTGRATINEELQIGDTVFPVGAVLDSSWEFDIYKAGWAWSFINVQKFEFFLGAGLNIRRANLKFAETGLGAGSTQQFDGSGTIPLPTFTFGGIYYITKKLSAQFRLEGFALEFGDYKGRLQDNYITLDYGITDHFGIGGGLNFYNLDIEITDTELRGELESDYVGLLLYVKGFFGARK